MPRSAKIQEFLAMAGSFPVIDVRSPGEFAKGRLPSAVNIALFDDEQRATVGTIYQDMGHDAAVMKGLELAGPRMAELATAMLKVAENAEIKGGGDGARRLLIHCWRGGMRSQSMAWLAEQTGCQTVLLDGGYKSFRRHVLESFSKPLNIVVLSGLTGAGKTRQLELLESAGEQIIDLEGLANHRGSAFGGIGLPDQPTVEHFENKLARQLATLDPLRRIWMEDESRKIGQVIIPDDLFTQLKNAPALFLDVPVAERARIITDEYGDMPIEALAHSVDKITKRLGGQNANEAHAALKQNDIGAAVVILLQYYDRTYLTAKSRVHRDAYMELSVTEPTSSAATELIIQAADELCCRSGT